MAACQHSARIVRVDQELVDYYWGRIERPNAGTIVNTYYYSSEKGERWSSILFDDCICGFNIVDGQTYSNRTLLV